MCKLISVIYMSLLYPISLCARNTNQLQMKFVFIYFNLFFIIIILEQHRKSEEKIKMSTSEKDESQAKVLSMIKERDEFAKLALERGKALEVSQWLLLWLNI